MRTEQLSESVTLHLGDCREASLPRSGAAIVSDPPYGMNYTLPSASREAAKRGAKHLSSLAGGGMRTEQLSKSVTLHLADCREASLPKAGAAIVSDPPYGMNHNVDSTRFSGGGLHRVEAVAIGRPSSMTTSRLTLRPGLNGRSASYSAQIISSSACRKAGC